MTNYQSNTIPYFLKYPDKEYKVLLELRKGKTGNYIFLCNFIKKDNEEYIRKHMGYIVHKDKKSLLVIYLNEYDPKKKFKLVDLNIYNDEAKTDNDDTSDEDSECFK